MKQKSIREFIREHRDKLDSHIREKAKWDGRINDGDRHMWILNDEYIYRWAQSEGVDV